ncbi:unnamed protein product [Spirodela intermedia]|uniref:Germin-like protein n=1 Tax=Spirodela intermedia TaxID=51605 RepID=A0A7I8KA76_SPIIN|nr:unnamed protein product [Spirodela intermedia]
MKPTRRVPSRTRSISVALGWMWGGFTPPGANVWIRLINKGDVFVFPQGLIHFQLNIGRENAVAIAALSSQNPGVITVANTVFGSNPAINDDVLAKALQVDKKVVDHLQSLFWTENH